MFPTSYFGVIASGRHRNNWDEDGSLFIDRSPKHFAMILDYLRSGETTPIAFESDHHMDEVRCEAEFYSLEHLAAKCRRFKVLDTHFMSLVKRRSQDFGTLTGMRSAAAMFDVIDSNNFEVTFEGQDWSDLWNKYNTPGVLIGVVPMDAKLSEEWRACDNPLPVVEPGPFHAGFACSWARVRNRYPVNVEEASRCWPQEVMVPPAVLSGVVCSLTVCNFREAPLEKWATEYQADGFLTQCLIKGVVKHSCWWSRPHASVSLRFMREPDTVTLQLVFRDDDGDCDYHAIELSAEGLDPNEPYRPAIFYGTKQDVDVKATFEEP